MTLSRMGFFLLLLLFPFKTLFFFFTLEGKIRKEKANKAITQRRAPASKPVDSVCGFGTNRLGAFIKEKWRETAVSGLPSALRPLYLNLCL